MDKQKYILLSDGCATIVISLSDPPPSSGKRPRKRVKCRQNKTGSMP